MVVACSDAGTCARRRIRCRWIAADDRAQRVGVEQDTPGQSRSGPGRSRPPRRAADIPRTVSSRSSHSASAPATAARPSGFPVGPRRASGSRPQHHSRPAAPGDVRSARPPRRGRSAPRSGSSPRRIPAEPPTSEGHRYAQQSSAWIMTYLGSVPETPWHVSRARCARSADCPGGLEAPEPEPTGLERGVALEVACEIVDGGLLPQRRSCGGPGAGARPVRIGLGVSLRVGGLIRVWRHWSYSVVTSVVARWSRADIGSGLGQPSSGRRQALAGKRFGTRDWVRT